MKLIVLDRDGVINHDSDRYITTVEQWRPIAGSLAAIARLKQYGYTVAVATNQSGVGRGLLDLQTLQAMHIKMQYMLAALNCQLDGIFFCPHLPKDRCNCRKPKPGLLLRIAQYFACQQTHMTMVGDAPGDIAAALAAGCQAVLVKTGKGTKTLASFDGSKVPSPVFDSLAHFVEQLIP